MEKNIFIFDFSRDLFKDKLFQKSYSGSRLYIIYDDNLFSIISYAFKPIFLVFSPNRFLCGSSPNNQEEVELHWSVKKPSVKLFWFEYSLNMEWNSVWLSNWEIVGPTITKVFFPKNYV